jgi:DNA replication protein DnaC
MTDSVLQSKEFLSELARYYMEFLESDFSGRTLPSRKIDTDPDSEVHLTDYPGLNDMAIGAFLAHFTGNPFDSINRDSIVLRIPDSLIQEVSLKFDSESFDFRSIETHINRELRKLKIPGKFRFTDFLDKRPEPDKEDILQFLSSYRLAGFYEEIYELWKNKLMSEKHEFYLYFYDLTCGDQSYPIFYIPITVEHSDQGEFSFEFDPVLLINKKAIEYVTNRFAEDEQKEWRVELPPRHVYLANFQSSIEFVSFLQSIMNELTNFLSLKPVTLNQSGKGNHQSNRGKYEISNCCYLVLADKSDESLLNDYEELLTMIHSGENSEALAVFTKLSEDFLARNPRSFAQEIEEDYEGKVCSERLTYTSPIPLNKEQIQVLKAIETDGCDRIIIEGPPGTGKSHTITAIIFNALMKGKSVLMVSDKKEALDVVEDKINSVLDKMKLDDFVQNPILRLGKKETNFTSIFKTVNYEKIKTRHGAFRRHREQIENEVQSIHQGIKSDIEKEIDSQFFLHSEQVQNYLSFDEAFQTKWKKWLNQDELGDGVKPQNLFNIWKSVYGIRNAVEQMEETCGLKFSLEDLTLSQWRNKLQDLLKDLLICSSPKRTGIISCNK